MAPAPLRLCFVDTLQ